MTTVYPMGCLFACDNVMWITCLLPCSPVVGICLLSNIVITIHNCMDTYNSSKSLSIVKCGFI